MDAVEEGFVPASKFEKLVSKLNRKPMIGKGPIYGQVKSLAKKLRKGQVIFFLAEMTSAAHSRAFVVATNNNIKKQDLSWLQEEIDTGRMSHGGIYILPEKKVANLVESTPSGASKRAKIGVALDEQFKSIYIALEDAGRAVLPSPRTLTKWEGNNPVVLLKASIDGWEEVIRVYLGDGDCTIVVQKGHVKTPHMVELKATLPLANMEDITIRMSLRQLIEDMHMAVALQLRRIS